ncbi:uncharacterized protein ATNIH1004_003079 [Aspergillus tanneri]|uniref:Ketoreductase domain-containing protein n=1 Tax=Aspergillus tanneri TaxID=1220188 RepID=A0A5M9MTI6_9EURO|nr:uncharacterized protein ATNIH1004_003079 [Aspergillus tanneri]KAA8650395.1 hypothetical protein ATNIH1004_003079 [Aspergillus tanneri]
MQEYHLDTSLLSHASTKTVVITGGANGIGAATATLFNAHGANVVISDLEEYRGRAESLIQTFAYSNRAAFLAADILDWQQMTALFHQAAQRFGHIDIVIANAGTMESKPVLDMNDVDEDGNLRESTEGFKVIDVNLKGTLNRSIVLLASTSGYFGGTGVTAYVASKHGIVGLLRASQDTARQYGIRLNGIAPFFTPTQITAGFAQKWQDAGLEANTVQGVAEAIAHVSMDGEKNGSCILVAGKYLRELEGTRTELIPVWLGQDVAEFMGRAMQFMREIGGYVLPRWRS